MTETTQTIVCPRCAETIKAAAKVCPYCRRPRRRIFISEHEACALASCLLLIAAIYLALCFFGGKQFSPEKHKITVLSAGFGIETITDNFPYPSNQTNVVITNVVMSGVLTNASEYSWRLNKIEVRFLDSAGKTLDVSGGYPYLTVLPHSDNAFRVTLRMIKSIPAYSSTKVTVTEASDPEYWFNN